MSSSVFRKERHSVSRLVVHWVVCHEVPVQGVRRSRYRVAANSPRQGVLDDGCATDGTGWTGRSRPPVDRVPAKAVGVGDDQRLERHIKSPSAPGSTRHRVEVLERRAVVAVVLRRQRRRCAPGNHQGLRRGAARVLGNVSSPRGLPLYLPSMNGGVSREFR